MHQESYLCRVALGKPLSVFGPLSNEEVGIAALQTHFHSDSLRLWAGRATSMALQLQGWAIPRFTPAHGGRGAFPSTDACGLHIPITELKRRGAGVGRLQAMLRGP